MAVLFKEHWDKIYATTLVAQLGWYEPRSYPSIQLIERCAVSKDSPLVDIGSGASTLIPRLLELGYHNITAIDISPVALEKAKASLERKLATQVHWLVEDVTHPSVALLSQRAAVWHDRAMFHFLTGEDQRQAYHSALQKMVVPGGFVILATFALDGAEKCSGLPVQRYDAGSLGDFLGEGFRLVESMNYTYQMPSGGLRPYVYACFQRE
jgi:SAM-dependent methyltransferase